MKVKLSWWMNVVQTALTWHLAMGRRSSPYMLFRSGGSKIEVISSEIPSQKFVHDWGTVGAHDMCNITPHQLNAFIATGDCLDCAAIAKMTFP